MMAKAWMKQDQAPQSEALETWNTLEAEFNEERKAMLMASAESDKIKDAMNKKYGPGTMKYGSEIPQPAQREDVIQIDAVNRFMKRNPRAEGGRMNFDNGGGADKYITPARRSGAEGFQGIKFKSVKDESYSEGRKRVKTKEYSAWLKNEQEKHKKNPNRYKQMSNPRREPGLIRIAEAMQQADIYDDAEYMMPNKEAMKAREKDFGRKQKIYKKGMLEAADIVYINGLEKNFDDVIFIADQLGEDPDWVLDQLDERTNFRDFAKGEKDILKKDPKYTKPRNDYLKVENWVQKNAKRYANPETFENALIKRFGKDNQFVKDLKSNKPFVQTYFSEGFTKTMLNKSSSKARSTPAHLNEFIKSSLYNFNPKIKEAVTTEIKGIFNSENLPKLRTEARKLLNNNKLLSKFGLNKAITGPFAKVIQAEIGQQMWDDITNFRQHRVGTQEMLKAFEQIVADEFKPIFNESAKAIGHSKNNQWKKAKEVFGIADNIAWDHKVPSSIIDKGYADIIEYTKVNPTTSNFNERIKNAQFDRKINKEIVKFENAKTLDEKVKIKNNMETIKNNFSEKYGGYLDEVSINLDEKGNLKFSSSAKPLTMGDERVAMLGKSLVQEGKFTDKEIKDIIKSVGCPNFKSSGGRIEFSTGADCFDKGQKLINNGMKGASPASLKNLAKLGPMLLKAGSAVMSGLIVPEALIVGLDAAARVGLGDTPSEAILRATDYITPDSFFGDYMQKADLMKIERTLGKDVKNIAAQSFDRTNQLDKIKNLEKNLKNLEAMSESGNFGYVGDLTNQINMTKDQIKKEKNALENKFTTTGQESKDFYTQQAFDDAYDASIAKSKFAAKSLADSESENPRLSAEQAMQDMKSQEELNKGLSIRSPLTGSKGETAFLKLSQLPMGPRMPSEIDMLAASVNKKFKDMGSDKKVTSQALKFNQDKKQMFKDASIEELVNMGLPLEAILGFNIAQPVETEGPGYYSNYKPLNRFGSQERPVLYPKGRGQLSEGGITELRSKYEYKK